MLKKTILCALLAALSSTAAADEYARYATSVGYTTDASDGVTGVYFQIVAEQGAPSDAYAVIGGVYPMRASNVSGDIRIPETLLGVPVRKIADGAFVSRTSLKSVTLPSNLREIGDNAFGWCTSLTNVTFAGTGVKSVGEACFSNCTALVSVKFPPSLEYIAPNVFALCDKLASVTFEGNAPMLDPPSRDTQVSYFGEKRWAGSSTPPRTVFRVKTGTYGWNGPYKSGLPDRWPLSHGFMNAHPVEPWTPPPSKGFTMKIADKRD